MILGKQVDVVIFSQQDIPELYNELGKCKNAISAKIRELESQIKSALSYEAEQRRLREEELARQREEANNG